MRLYLMLIPIVFITFISCVKNEEVGSPDLKVEVMQATVKAGDSVKFSFKGNADIVSWYSGEYGNDYEYVDKDRIVSLSSMPLSLSTMVRAQGTPAPTFCQPDQFHIFISTDFVLSGNSTADSISSIRNATWQEITDRFTLCPLECLSTTGFFPGGEIDLLDLVPKGKSFVLAFQYINLVSNSENGRSNIWRVSELKLNANNALGSTSIISQNNGGWYPVFIGDNWNRTLYSSTATQLTLRGAIDNPADQELWCISRKIDVNDANLGHEFSVAIKTLQDPSLKSYAHIYNTPGVYTATFVAVNANGTSSIKTVQQIEITVTP